MTLNVLFLCPHNAAKSIAAAAFAAREANQRGITINTSTAGTDPDPDILPIVRERLEAQSLPIDQPPRKLTENDFLIADVIVNIGCDPAALPTTKPTRHWQIPNFSDNAQAAFVALENHAADLIGQLTTPTP